LEVKDDLGVQPSADLLDRIQAGSSLFTSNLFFLSLEAFSPICNALNFGPVTAQVLIPADLDDVLWGITEARMLVGTQDKFSHNIARYVGVLLQQEGIVKPPSVLSFAEYDPQGAINTQDAFLTDEVLYQVYWEEQQKQKDFLEELNKQKLLLLMQQLADLPLVNGDASLIRQRLAQAK
jgi:hypothetical protein